MKLAKEQSWRQKAHFVKLYVFIKLFTLNWTDDEKWNCKCFLCNVDKIYSMACNCGHCGHDKRLTNIEKCQVNEYIEKIETTQSKPHAYLIFVIFFTRANFWRIRFTPKNANFRVKSVKNATSSRKICLKCQFFALNL